jgi:hypothetical protein
VELYFHQPISLYNLVLIYVHDTSTWYLVKHRDNFTSPLPLLFLSRFVIYYLFLKCLSVRFFHEQLYIKEDNIKTEF